MTGLETCVAGGFTLLIVAVLVILFIFNLVPLPLWIAAWASGAYVGLVTLIGMRLRRVPPHTVITARISAVKAPVATSGVAGLIWRPAPGHGRQPPTSLGDESISSAPQGMGLAAGALADSAAVSIQERAPPSVARV